MLRGMETAGVVLLCALGAGVMFWSAFDDKRVRGEDWEFEPPGWLPILRRLPLWAARSVLVGLGVLIVLVGVYKLVDT
jgi:hypothetical protein